MYFNWRRDYIPAFFEGFGELEMLLLAEAVNLPVSDAVEQVPVDSLSYQLAQFQVFNEAMAIGRRHYSPQSCGEQHGCLKEYQFHQFLGKRVLGVLAERVSEIEAENEDEDE